VVAGGIAPITLIVNLGGFVGPFALGWIKDATGSYEWALYFLAAFAPRPPSSPTSRSHPARLRATLERSQPFGRNGFQR
jgi:hypothetical protein